jgi:hypothetical protein
MTQVTAFRFLLAAEGHFSIAHQALDEGPEAWQAFVDVGVGALDIFTQARLEVFHSASPEERVQIQLLVENSLHVERFRRAA